MEFPSPVQRPIGCRTLLRGGIQLKASPAVGFCTRGASSLFTISYGWNNYWKTAKITFPFTASADFSRKRQRKVSTPRSKESSPKGFTPRTQLPPTSTQRRDQKNAEEEEAPHISPSTEFEGSKTKTIEAETGADEKVVDNFDQVSNIDDSNDNDDGIVVESTFYKGPLCDDKVSQYGDKESFLTVDEDWISPNDTESFSKSEEKGATSIDFYLYGRDTDPRQMHSTSKEVPWSESIEKEKLKEATPQYASGAPDSRLNEFKNMSDTMDQNESMRFIDDTGKTEFVQREATEKFANLVIGSEEIRDPFPMIKLDSADDLRKKAIDKIAEKNFNEGNKFFIYPEVARSGQDIEVFFNRSESSTLKNEDDIVIMGAFNGWKWKSFNIQLNKNHFNGDWWSCQVHVPEEAYSIDFVFHNGKDVYDNNDENDFCITVEGVMDEFDFENFLLEDKRRELEELTRKNAESERLAEEQRRAEAEKAAIEADRAQARMEVAKRMGPLKELMKKAVVSVPNVWCIEPTEYKGGDKIRLFYNRSSGPLSSSKEVWVHGGHDGWKLGLSLFSKLVKSRNKDGDWWYTDVVLPDQALVLNWVFADGPPQKAIVFDNNNGQDFHAIVPNGSFEEVYRFEEEHMYRTLQTERQQREKYMQAKAEKTAQMKVETKARTLKRFLLSQKHTVYTDPLEIHAGSTITVFYNPANTVLNGKSEIWLRYSFNRWTHRMGPFPPQRMLSGGNGSHLKATVKVPLDSYLMDFVFSEREDGGIFDNKDGMDYHIPVLGGVLKESPLHIVHIAVEMAPIAKVGGLGDVVTSLSRAVQGMNHNVDIIIPKYDCLDFTHVKDLKFHRIYSWGGTEIKVWSGKVEGLNVYFLEPQNGLFWVGCIYGRHNDSERFGFFCHSALEFLLQCGFHPDIIHCHDWSSAPVSWLFKEHYMHYGLSKARVVFTIHNLEFGAQMIAKAMQFSDKATTVSPTYSREISGNPAVASHIFKFHGILNGIDPDMWDPYNDKFIPVSYTSENVVEGKRAAKEALQQKLGLKRAELPLVGIISRLTHQKGIHLIKHAIWRTLERGGQIVLLGSAPDSRIQNDFVNLANQVHSTHNDRARLCLSYDEPLSHLIYAGADFILVPSIFEPCGLTQLTALRYGSVPVVRKTGGLYDTVFDVDHDEERAQAQGLEPNGFSFDGADPAGVDYALNRAITSWYNNREWFNSLCKLVMEQDWSWNRPALDYLELYHAARK